MVASGWFARVLAVVLSALPVAGWAAGKCERLVVTGSPDAPPYLWRDPQDPKHLMGANADLLKEAAAQIGVDVEFLYAGKRSQAYEEVRSGRMDMLVDATLNVARLESLDYVYPPIARNEILVWVRQSSGESLRTLEQLHGHAGAISDKTRLTPVFEAAIRQQLSLQVMPSLTQAFQKLALGQVEYVLAGRYAGMALVQALGMAADIRAHSAVLDTPGLHLALSFNSACNEPWLRGQLAKKMTESAVSGLASAAIERNLLMWKAQLQQPASAPNQ